MEIPQQMPQEMMITPSPVPTMVQIGTVDDNVIMSFLSPTGQAVFFLPHTEIDAIIAGLNQARAVAKTGLVIPQGVVPPTPPSPNGSPNG